LEIDILIDVHWNMEIMSTDHNNIGAARSTGWCSHGFLAEGGGHSATAKAAAAFSRRPWLLKGLRALFSCQFRGGEIINKE